MYVETAYYGDSGDFNRIFRPAIFLFSTHLIALRQF